MSSDNASVDAEADNSENNSGANNTWPGFTLSDDFDQSRKVLHIEFGSMAFRKEEAREVPIHALLIKALSDLDSAITLGHNPVIVTGAERDPVYALYDISVLSGIVEGLVEGENGPQVALDDDVKLSDIRDDTVEAIESLTPEFVEMLVELPEELDIFDLNPDHKQYVDDYDSEGEAWWGTRSWANRILHDDYPVDFYVDIGDRASNYWNNEGWGISADRNGVPSLKIPVQEWAEVHGDEIYAHIQDDDEDVEVDDNA